jgi:hypothetical protein
VDGVLRWREKPIAAHTVGEKTIPSNFFAQDRHKYVSAVIFTNAGTQAKFNRMGIQAGFGDDAVQLVRAGGLHMPGDYAYEPEAFFINVEDPEYFEDWDDELEIFHNPNAVHPISDDFFPTAANYRVINGEVRWDSPKRPILFSRTRSLLFPFRGPEDVVAGKTGKPVAEPQEASQPPNDLASRVAHGKVPRKRKAAPKKAAKKSVIGDGGKKLASALKSRKTAKTGRGKMGGKPPRK